MSWLSELTVWVIALAILAGSVIFVLWIIIELIDFVNWIFLGGKGPFSKS